MLKILGIFILLGSLLVLLVGAGGAVANFFFSPKAYSCEQAEISFKKLESAKKAYDAAKGTAGEYSAEYEFEQVLKEHQMNSVSCGKMQDSAKFYGFVFAGVGVVGFIGVLLGGLLTIIGFRKKKMA